MRATFLILASITAAQAQTVSPLGARGYTVLPEPQRVELTGGDTGFGPAWSLELGPGVKGDNVAAETLESELRDRFGLRRRPAPSTVVRLSMLSGSVAPGPSADIDKAAVAEQAYRIEIGDGRVSIAANAPAGLFYGIETLVQLLKPAPEGLCLPRGVITDWPDLHLRHIYWDDAHHLERLPELKRAVRQAAFFKINGIALKLEGHFQFRSAPAVVEPYALTPAEYQELTDYGLRYHVQVIPYLDGPAHIAFILKHPEYTKYRAFPDSNYELCVANPEAVRMLSGMFQDLVDANRGGKFVYLSTDEPYYVGLADNSQCREKSPASEKGSVGRLLADFIARVADPLHAAGRTVIFWGEYPLKPGDVEALPSYLVNGEATGGEFTARFRDRGIGQMIYTYTQADWSHLFPDYFPATASRRLHPATSTADRVAAGIRTISSDPARKGSRLMGAVVAGWGDLGLHPETFWLGYSTIAAAAWRPGSPSTQESAAAFYRLFYGDGATGMDRAYQLLSQQAAFWGDSWEKGPSPRKPIFGNHATIFQPRQPVFDAALPLPPPPNAELRFDAEWMTGNARRLDLATDFLADNDELLGLLHENLQRARFNKYNLEVYVAIARLYRHNIELLRGIGRMCALLAAAQTAAADGRAADAIGAVDRAIAVAREIRQDRNVALRDAISTYGQSWYPRVAEANGRKFLHDLDDVKDHLPDRTVDMSFLVYRQLQLPFGQWVEQIQAARNEYAAGHRLPLNSERFDWRDLTPEER